MGRIDDLLSMALERRIGFRADEVMSGTHHFIGDAGPMGEYPMEFRVTWGHPRMERFLNPLGGEFMVADLAGVVDVGGLCTAAACQGRLELRYLQEAKLRYVFDFEHDGKRYHFVGEKRNLRPWNLHRTHTTCYGELRDADSGILLSESVTYFRLRTAPAFMASFRLA